MGKVRVTQIKSGIKRPSTQKKTLVALGLSKINSSVEHDDNPVIRGMIKKVEHLVAVESLN